MTEVVTDIPRCFSISIQSLVAVLRILLFLTAPATCICPPNSSSFSVSVVLPASGCDMMAKVRRRCISFIVWLFVVCVVLSVGVVLCVALLFVVLSGGVVWVYCISFLMHFCNDSSQYGMLMW